MKYIASSFFKLLIVAVVGTSIWYNWGLISAWGADKIVFPWQCKTTPWVFDSPEGKFSTAMSWARLDLSAGYPSWAGRYSRRAFSLPEDLYRATESLREGATLLTVADNTIGIKTGPVTLKNALSGLQPACDRGALEIRFYIEDVTPQSFGGPSREWFFSADLKGDTVQAGYAMNLRTRGEYCFTFLSLHHEKPGEDEKTYVFVDIKDLVPCNKKE